MNQDAPAGSEMTKAMVVSLVLVAGASLADDQVLPFYSVTFGAGTAAAYYFAITFGPLGALMISTSVLVCMLLQAMSRGGAALDVMVLQSPAMVVFFVGLSCTPVLLAWILQAEEHDILQESSYLEAKIKELEDSIAAERKDQVEDRSMDDKEELLKITSRSTQLAGFLREVLQASSTKEITHLLFTNITKAFGANEVALLNLLEGGEEMIVAKAAHPEYGTLESRKLSLESAPILVSALEKTVPMLLPERIVYLEPDLGARVILPIRVDGKCEALITLGKTRNEAELSAEDAHFLGGLADLAGNAMDQLKVVLGT